MAGYAVINTGKSAKRRDHAGLRKPTRQHNISHGTSQHYPNTNIINYATTVNTNYNERMEYIL